MREQAFPPRVEKREHRQKDVTQVRERDFDLVCDVETLAPEGARLPEQRDLPEDRLLDGIAVRRFRAADVALAHELGDTVSVVDHALAHDFCGMRSEHRHDERVVQQRSDGVSW